MLHSQLIPQISKTIHQIIPDAKVVLYGSVARGTATENSDIDILIILNKDRIYYDDKQLVSDPLFDLSYETGICISPLVITQHEWEEPSIRTPFIINILNEGRVI